MKKDTLLFLLLVLIWGTSFPINKVGLDYTSVPNFIEWRLLLATAGTFLLALFTKNLILPSKKDLPVLIAVGVFQMGLTLLLSTYGLSLTQAGKATFLMYTTPIWVILITAFLYKRFTALDAAAFFLGLIGTVILVEPWDFRMSDVSSWAGEVCLVLSALVWSIGIIATNKLPWHKPPQQLLFWELLIATLMAALYARWQGAPLIPETVNAPLVGALLYSSLLSTALGYWLMILVSKNISSAVVSFGLLCIPIISLTLSYFFLAEPITLHLVVSVSLILAGILLRIRSEAIEERGGH